MMASCSGKKNTNEPEFSNDLENLAGWSGTDNNAASIQKGIARSGMYGSVTDTANRYGFMFKCNLNTVSDEKIRLVKAAVWVYEEEQNNDAVLVMTVDSAGKTILWEGKKLNEFVKKKNTWTEVIAQLDLSKLQASPDLRFAFYVWNTGSTRIVTDDHRVRFYK